MKQSNYVKWGRNLVPRFLCEPDDFRPGECSRCGGLGLIPEMIDDEQHEEMVPCFMCREYCKACGNWVRKSGHECKPKGA